ncbi:MAG TPA: DinB family protein [Gemmatimonadaceae bacterium]|jgi:uncharacterized damage-inducible protein DinB|nr:DinB family protein [Gemmatimonadaceae bacterium]
MISRTLARCALLAAIASVAPAAAHSQDALDARAVAHLRDQYAADLDTVHAKIMQLARAIPAEKYSWRPAAGVRSVSEALMHVAGEWYYYTPMSVAGTAPPDFGTPREKLPALEKITTKDAVVGELEKSWAHCADQLRAADPSRLTGSYKPWGIPMDQAAFVMAGDLHEHLGQLIAYARTIGVKPPWSKA